MRKTACKPLLAGLMVLLVALGLSACGREGMRIEKARLSRAENDILQLFGASGDSELLYDYRVDDAVQSVRVNCYELIDGQWETITGGGSLACNAKKGRVALRFGMLGDELRVALQDGRDISACEVKSAAEIGNLGQISTVTAESAQIAYEQEIPLAMQINTAKGEVRSFSPEMYFEPAQISECGYDRVYALTVAFSTAPLE